jgi:hypothetical protein
MKSSIPAEGRHRSFGLEGGIGSSILFFALPSFLSPPHPSTPPYPPYPSPFIALVAPKYSSYSRFSPQITPFPPSDFLSPRTTFVVKPCRTPSATKETRRSVPLADRPSNGPSTSSGVGVDRVGSRQREYGTREWSQGAEKMCIAIAGSRSIGEYEIPPQSIIPTSLCPLPLLSLSPSLPLFFALFFVLFLSTAWVRHGVILV